MSSLIVLHGFRQNGAHLHEHLRPLRTRWPESLQLEVPDGTRTCSPASLSRLAPMLGRGNPEPHLCWWDATDDGSEYRGYEASRDLLHELLERAARPRGILGFSQGAGLCAIACALSGRGEFPALDFAIVVAGRKPRATALAPLFDTPVALPSLHVMGTRDPSLPYSERLAECFAPERREIARWDGPHVLPTYGPGADAIEDFVTRQLGAALADHRG
jgi:predicted esterase